jgi:transcriptional regulator with XRE-family HTH domain
MNDAETDESLRPKHLTKQEFGRRLYRLMLAKGWTQSELARRAGLARDSVSTYVRGVSLPEALNLDKLAKALGVTAAELLPNHAENAIDNDAPSLELKISSANTLVSWLRVNRLVSTTTAMKVVELLNADEIPNASDGD